MADPLEEYRALARAVNEARRAREGPPMRPPPDPRRVPAPAVGEVEGPFLLMAGRDAVSETETAEDQADRVEREIEADTLPPPEGARFTPARERPRRERTPSMFDPALERLLPGFPRDPDAPAQAWDRLQGWLRPTEGVSRAIGGLIEGGNPIDPDAPTTSEALEGRGAHPLVAAGAEFLVPDVGGSAADIFPVGAAIARLPWGRLTRKAAKREGATHVMDILDRAEHASERGLSPLLRDVEEMATHDLDELSRGQPLMGNQELADVVSRSEGHPSRIYLRRDGDNAIVVQNGVAIDVMADPDVPGGEELHVSRLYNAGEEGDTKFASAPMAVLDLADAYDVPMSASPMAFGHKRMPTEDLAWMYNGMGFEADPSGVPLMRRTPMPLTSAERAAEADRRIQGYRRGAEKPSRARARERADVEAGIAGDEDRAEAAVDSWTERANASLDQAPTARGHLARLMSREDSPLRLALDVAGADDVRHRGTVARIRNHIVEARRGMRDLADVRGEVDRYLEALEGDLPSSPMRDRLVEEVGDTFRQLLREALR